jgi:alkyl sulfatase BDS1-like metallo-beta-lactamase superfamily hydrolase
VRLTLPFDDVRDIDDALRGRIAPLAETVIRNTSGRVVWDMDAYADQALDAACPATVNPSLWRQATLNNVAGLFEVTTSIYQVRGLDISNMTLVEGDEGVIVIDPLISCETAAAALALYRSHRGNRPVTAVIYTHSHIDHFGGVRGVIDDADVDSGRVAVIAPEGFLEHAVSENVYAGPAMTRRAQYMYGAFLPKGPAGQVDAGLGKTSSTGRVSLIAPTITVSTTGEELVVDGVRIVFQMTPGTEAPAEMNFHFPDLRALCLAENATHNLHNVVTLRGALVRDSLLWSKLLDETLAMFLDGTDVAFAQHHWPSWGRDRIQEHLEHQRDLYRYLHDQTLRLMNSGLTGPEIAERITLPPGLARDWACREYYGSVSHNVKAIYQRYLGWFDGHPANLAALPPVDAAPRYVALMGGAQAVRDAARIAMDAGDERWAAQLLTHCVFADADDMESRELQALAFEQLAYRSENTTWRNFYLMGALELRQGVLSVPSRPANPEMVAALSIEQVFDAIGLRIDGVRAADERIVLNWIFTDLAGSADGNWACWVSNGAFGARRAWKDPSAQATLTTTKGAFIAVVVGGQDTSEAFADGRIALDGDANAVVTLFGLVERPLGQFPIVTR